MRKVNHYYLGNYPDEKATGWCEDIEGVTHDDNNWFFTQMTRLWKFPVTHDLNEVVRGPDPSRGILQTGMPSALSGYDHFGDIDHYGGFLFVPTEHSERSLVPRIAVFRANDLGYVGSTEVSAYQGVGWCAIEPNDGFLYTSSDEISPGNDIRKYKINMESLEVRGQVILEDIGTLPIFDSSGLPMKLTILQGGTFSRVGNLYLLCGYYKDCDPNTHGIRVFDPSGLLIAASSNTEMPFKQ